MEHVPLAPYLNGVTGVATAVVPDRGGKVLREVVDHLTLALITPLQTDHSGISHGKRGKPDIRIAGRKEEEEKRQDKIRGKKRNRKKKQGMETEQRRVPRLRDRERLMRPNNAARGYPRTPIKPNRT